MDHATGQVVLPSGASAAGEFVAHNATVTCLSIGPKTGRLLATASEDRKVNLWPVAKSNCLASLSGHTSTIESVKFGRNEDIVCAGSVSGALKVWDLEAGQILRTFSGHKSGITCIDFHPFGDFFASGSLDSNIKLWDTRKKSCMYAYKAHSKDVRCLRFSPDGRWLASGGDEGIIKIWDLAAGKILAEFNEHSAPVTDLAFHPNELLLTSCSMDGTARFWDLEAFTQVSVTGNEAGSMYRVAFNTDGTILFACARDLLKCYQWEPTRILSSLIVNWGKIKDLYVSPNQMIAASSSAMSVSVFAVNLSNKKSSSALTTNALSSLNASFSANLSFSTSNLSSMSNQLSPPTTITTNNQSLHKSSSNVAIGASSQIMRLPPINNLNSNNNNNSSSNSHPLNCKNSNSKVPPKAAVVFPEPHVSSISAVGPNKKSAEITPLTNSSFTLSSSSSSSSTKSTAAVKSMQQQSNERLDLFPSSAKDLHLNSQTSSQDVRASAWNPIHHNNAGTKELQQAANGKVPPKATKAAAIIFPEPQQTIRKKTSPPSSLLFGNEERIDVIPESRDRPAGLDIDEFLPKHLQDTVRQGYHPQPEISETEAMTSIMKGHKSLVTALSHRKKNVQIVLALWSSKDPVKALEQAIHFDDPSIIVDVLNVINLKP